MANKIENIALFVVAENNEMKFATSEAEGGVRVAQVYLDGNRLEGVYSEVEAGSLNGILAASLNFDDRAEVPADIKQRNDALQKWSDASKKVNRAKKAGISSVMLLSLAACGGEGGSAVAVKTDSLSPSDDRADISGASAGAVITVVSETAGNDYEDREVTITASGSGELRIEFAEDGNDNVVLSSSTDIRGFSTIIVEHGTVDFTAVTLSSDVEIIKVGSGVVLTHSQFDGLSSIDLRDGALSGELTVIVDDLAQARLVDTSTKIGAGIDREIDMAGDVGELSFADLVELQELVGPEEQLIYTIKDNAENLFVFEDGVAVEFQAGVEAVLDAANGVTIVDAKLSVNAALLENLRNLDVTFEGQVFNLERSLSAVAEGDSVVFTLDTVNVAQDARYDYIISGVSAADVGAATGTFVVGADGKSYATVNIVADRVTEGAETLTLSVAGQTQSVDVNDTSLSPTFALTADQATVDEGQTAIYSLQTTNVDQGATYDYVITGVSAADVVGGSLTGTATIDANGRAEIRVALVADRVTEGAETLSLSVAGQTQSVDVNDTSLDDDQRFTSDLDNLEGNNAFDNKFIGSVSVDVANSTFEPGDALDGKGGNNTLELFMDPGTVADGVEVRNIQTLEVRLNAATSPASNPSSELVMTDWDGSLDEMNIRSNKSNLVVTELQSNADISIVDNGIGDAVSAYSFNYAAGVLDEGTDDKLFLDVDNVNGTGGSTVTVDGRMEAAEIGVQDRAGAQYVSNINLNASGLADIEIVDGRAAQAFVLNADVAAGADFDSTGFVGNMDLTSADIRRAEFGVGDDTVVATGEADNAEFDYDLREGNNTLTVGTSVAPLNLAGDVTSGSGNDSVTVYGNTIATEDARSSINLGDSDNVAGNTLAITGVHQGDLIAGDGRDTVTTGSNAAGSTVSVGNGFNTVTTTDHLGDISGGDGRDDVVVASTGADSSIDAGNGANSIAISGAHAGSITSGMGDDTVSAASTSDGSSIAVEGGLNSVTVGGVHAGGIEGGDDQDNVTVGSILGGVIMTSGGADSVVVEGNMINGTIDVGEGDGNSVSIVGFVAAAEPGTIVFGDGAENTLSVGGDLIGDAVVFGNGADNVFTIGGDVTDGATIMLGDGGNIGWIKGDVEYGSSVTFGGGEDGLTLGVGDSSGSPKLRGADQATQIDMGGGHDIVGMFAKSDSATNVLVRSGGFMDGNEGDDRLTLMSEQTVTNLISRTDNQVVTVDFTGETFTVGQEVSVTFTRDETDFTVTHTVSDADFVQGPDNIPSLVAAALQAKLDDTTAAYDAHFGAASRDGAMLTLTSDLPHEDFTVTSSVGEVEVVQISDTGITSFETLDLVVQNDAAAVQNVTIGANFELIDGTDNLNLNSQVQIVSAALDPLLNGTYTEYTSGGVTTFDLSNLVGDEVITVAGYEATATGNQQVSRITVETQDGDHLVGDKIIVTIDGQEVVYIVTAADLSAASGPLDAENIAVSLATAIASSANAAGMTVSRDSNVITLVGQHGEVTPVGVSHTRITETSLGSENFEEGDAFDVLGRLEGSVAGDKITIAMNGVPAVEYIVAAADCDRLNADGIVAFFANALDGARADFGSLVFDSAATVSATRMVDLASSDKTVAVVTQTATPTDDATADVILNASLAASSGSTDMDLTVDGHGAFDLNITGNTDANGYTDLSLTLADAFDHTIDLNGNYQMVGAETQVVQGNFSNSVTVVDGAEHSTAGQNVVLNEVLARSVDTSGADANFTIDQLGVRAANADDFAGEVITVATGDGDDHLMALAQSALEEGSAIDLGTGSNTLSLGWGQGVAVSGADLDEVGNISYTGDLSQFDLLNDVVLGQESTTLTLPSGASDVETLTFTNVETDEGTANLAVLGVNGTVSIISTNDFDLATKTPTIGSNPDSSNLSYDITAADDGTTDPFTDALTNSENFPSAEYVEPGQRVKGATFVAGFVPGTTLSVPDTFDDYGNDAVDDGQYEIYHGTYDASTGIFTVTLTRGTAGDPGQEFTDYPPSPELAPSHTLMLYDNDPSGEVKFVEGLVFEGFFQEQGFSFAGSGGDRVIFFDDSTDLYVPYTGGTSGGSVASPAGILSLSDDAGVLVTGDVTVSAGGTVVFNVGNTDLTSLTVQSGLDADIFVAGNTGALFNIDEVSITAGEGGNDAKLQVIDNSETAVTFGVVTLSAGATADFEVKDNSDLTIVVGEVSLTGGDPDVVIEGNTDSTVTIGTVAIDGSASSDTNELIFAGNTNSDLTLSGGVSITSAGTAEVQIGGSGSAENLDSNVVIAGDIDLMGSSANLEVNTNIRTNVSLADGGTINLVACDNDAVASVVDNLNDFLPDFGNPDQTAVTTSNYDVNLGAIVADAGNDATVSLTNNDDTTYYGELTVTVDRVDLFAYSNAAVSIVDNDATTVTVGTVDMVSQVNGSLAIGENDGDIYTVAPPGFAARREVDFANVSLGNVTIDADEGVGSVSVSGNDVARVQIGVVDVDAGGSATFVIDNNDDASVTVGSISVDVGTTAADTMAFSISDNDRVDTDLTIPLTTPALASSVTTGAVALTAGDTTTIAIDGNTGLSDTERSTVTVNGSFQSTSGDSITATISGNEFATINLGGTAVAPVVNLTSTDGASTLTIDANEDAAINLAGTTLQANGAGNVARLDIGNVNAPGFGVSVIDTVGASSGTSYAVAMNSGVISSTNFTNGSQTDPETGLGFDIDWFAVELVAGTQYQFSVYGDQTLGLGGTEDPTVAVFAEPSFPSDYDEALWPWLYGEDSEPAVLTLAFNDDADFSDDLAAAVLFTPEVSGTYYIDVRPYALDSAPGFYLLEVFENSEGLDGTPRYLDSAVLLDTAFGGGNFNTDITMADIRIDSNDDGAELLIRNNAGGVDDTDVTVTGATIIDGVTAADLSIVGNADVNVDLSLTGTVKIDARGEAGGASVGISSNTSSVVETGILDVDADNVVVDVRSNTDTIVRVASIDVDAVGAATFAVVGNTETLIELAVERDPETDTVISRSTIAINAASVGVYDAAWGFEVSGNSASEVFLGDVSIVATDSVPGDSDVALGLIAVNDVLIDVGNITISADNDAFVRMQASGENAEVRTGDLVISSGNEPEVNDLNASSDLYFNTIGLEGNDLNDNVGDNGQQITLTANSRGDGEGSVYASIATAPDLTTLTILGTNAEVYLTGSIGGDTAGTSSFTLDLSGVSGEFYDSSATFAPLGGGESDNLAQDGGSYVETWEADVGTDAIRVLIGSGDLIYNAQHSGFGGYPSLTGGLATDDWNDAEGWFSLNGNDNERYLSPVVAEQTITLDNVVYGDPNAETWFASSVIVQTEANREFAFVNAAYYDNTDGDEGWYNTQILFYEMVGGSFASVSEADVENALGAAISVGGGTGGNDYTITFTGTADGANFDTIVGGVYETRFGDANAINGVLGGAATGDLVSSSISGVGTFQTVDGVIAEDGIGNVASETFAFTGSEVGEVVIGGFNPGAWGSINPLNGQLTDRLDFGQFDWNGDGVLNDAGLVSLSDFSFTVVDSDGYFADVVIDFIGGSNLSAERSAELQGSEFDSIRLVGVGEFDTAVTLVQQSMIIA